MSAANGATLDRLVGRLLYAYGMVWYWPFKLTPSKWICWGCNGWDTLRGKWGAFVTSQFGWVRNWRYETLVDVQPNSPPRLHPPGRSAVDSAEKLR